MSVPLLATIRLPDHVLYRAVDGESVLLDIKSEEYFGLDDVGTRFLETVLAGDTLRDALAVLAEEYEVDEQTLVRDLQVLLENLAARNLVEVVGASVEEG